MACAKVFAHALDAMSRGQTTHPGMKANTRRILAPKSSAKAKMKAQARENVNTDGHKKDEATKWVGNNNHTERYEHIKTVAALFNIPPWAKCPPAKANRLIGLGPSTSTTSRGSRPLASTSIVANSVAVVKSKERPKVKAKANSVAVVKSKARAKVNAKRCSSPPSVARAKSEFFPM